MTKKQVLVLGASGFTGYNIFDRLTKREDLEVIGTFHTNRYGRCRVRENPNLFRVDLTDKKGVYHLTKGIDIIIQAAAMTSGIKDTEERPWIQITDNLRINALILESAHENGVQQVISFSSSIVYPPNANQALAEHNVDPKNLSLKHQMAAKTKIYLEDLSKFYADLGRTKYTIIRPANVYGPHDRFDIEKSHVLAAIITKTMMAKDQKITLWGSGSEQKDLLYISDLADLVELCINGQQAGFLTLNAGSGELISIRNLAEKIIDFSGKNLVIEWDLKGPTSWTNILLDNTRTENLLGWKRKVSLENGLVQTITWFKENMGRV